MLFPLGRWSQLLIGCAQIYAQITNYFNLSPPPPPPQEKKKERKKRRHCSVQLCQSSVSLLFYVWLVDLSIALPFVGRVSLLVIGSERPVNRTGSPQDKQIPSEADAHFKTLLIYILFCLFVWSQSTKPVGRIKRCWTKLTPPLWLTDEL